MLLGFLTSGVGMSGMLWNYILEYQKLQTEACLASSDLQLPLRQWGTGNIYVLVLYKAKR